MGNSTAFLGGPWRALTVAGLLASGALALLVAMATLASAQGTGCPSGLPLSPPPANDNYASSTSVSVPSTTAGNNNCATMEPMENVPCCSITRSIWYEFTAPGNGLGEANTCGSGFDTVLGVYDGTSP